MADAQPVVTLLHGNGGRQTQALIRDVFLEAYGNPHLSAMGDAAHLSLEHGELAFTTDSFVVSPPFFPGGDIGSLAVAGTVNDLAVSGARPQCLTAAFILEEGFPLADLERIARSMAATAAGAGVNIVAGDTKVVERGSGDGVFINTAGIGLLDTSTVPPGTRALQPGDVIMVSGPVGDHGTAVMAAREDFPLQVAVESDCACIHELAWAAQQAAPGQLRVMRDPTRGGLATTLCEFVAGSSVSITLQEAHIPLRPGVRSLCELTGVDPLYLACEGRLVLGIAPGAVETLLATLQAHPLGTEAAVIGRVGSEQPGSLLLNTVIGGTRVLDLLSGEMLPRIC